MSEPLPGSQVTTVQCERDRLLMWLREVFAAAESVDVRIVVEEAEDARSSVQITVRDIPHPLAGLELRRLA